jgi:hypothetical protein
MSVCTHPVSKTAGITTSPSLTGIVGGPIGKSCGFGGPYGLLSLLRAQFGTCDGHSIEFGSTRCLTAKTD